MGTFFVIFLSVAYFFFTFAVKAIREWHPLFQITHLSIMNLNFEGIIIALATFFIIGIFHPIVIKLEYYTGTKYWWVFLLTGIVSICAALFVADILWSSILGVLGASLLWSIGELKDQKKRVEKGWFPMNPKRKDEYDTTPYQQ